MVQILREAKRVVVDLVKSVARGRAVDIIWWEPSDDALTLYVEGRLEDGGASRTTHRFDRDALERLMDQDAREELQSQMQVLVARFARRPTPKGWRGGV